MKTFYVTAQCSTEVSVTGWHTVKVRATDRAAALDAFNRERSIGWRAASIESVVEAESRLARIGERLVAAWRAMAAAKE